MYKNTSPGSSCMGESTCFPLAFGVPAFFMVLAVIAFVLASKWYVKVPPLGNPIVDVAKVTWVGNIKTNISEKLPTVARSVHILMSNFTE